MAPTAGERGVARLGGNTVQTLKLPDTVDHDCDFIRDREDPETL